MSVWFISDDALGFKRKRQPTYAALLLLKFHERNFTNLAYRAFKCSLIVSWLIGLNDSEQHLRAAYEA